jgi:hypothetical protein
MLLRAGKQTYDLADINKEDVKVNRQRKDRTKSRDFRPNGVYIHTLLNLTI